MSLDSTASTLGWVADLPLPPAELAAHPSDTNGRHALYLMCDDLDTTVRDLRVKGVDVAREPSSEGWGPLTAIRLPGAANSEPWPWTSRRAGKYILFIGGNTSRT
jgi:hypothetical protein